MNFFNLLIALFTGSELLLLITKRSSRSASRDQSDKRSLLILWATISLSMTAAILSSARYWWMFPKTSLVELIGFSLVCLGLLIRWIAIGQLGKMFTVDVSISKTHQLNTSGVYRLIRHPSYLGLWLILAGFGLAMGSVLSFILQTVPVFLALHYRITTEERALEQAFGDHYNRYRKNTYRMIPGIY